MRKDGGEFDQFTGATVTPRAVVGAVANALAYFERHRDELLAPPATIPRHDARAKSSAPASATRIPDWCSCSAFARCSP